MTFTATDETTLLHQVFDIARMIRAVLKSKALPFPPQTEHCDKPVLSAKSPLWEMLVRASNCEFYLLLNDFPHYEYTPYLKLFEEVLKTGEHDLERAYVLRFKDKAMQAALNTFVDTLREKAKEPAFERSVQDFARLPNKNLQSLQQYFRKLIEAYPHLLALRIDLAYQNAMMSPNGKPPSISCDAVKSHFDELLKHLQQKLPNKPKVGYAWRLSHSRQKGWCVHLIVFLDATKAPLGKATAEMIGSVWYRITQGRGIFLAHHWHKSLSGEAPLDQNDGETLLDLNDPEALEALDRVALFLTMPELYLRLKSSDMNRTFGKGVAPRPKPRKPALPARAQG